MTVSHHVFQRFLIPTIRIHTASVRWRNVRGLRMQGVCSTERRRRQSGGGSLDGTRIDLGDPFESLQTPDVVDKGNHHKLSQHDLISG